MNEGRFLVALPEKKGGFAVDVFGEASAEDVVAVGDVAAVRQGDPDQAVQAVPHSSM
ncbi:hypothetical protein [Pseudomonas saxonica]|uniref:hypothetical protein n=1 Tax=Pseudomonas saxonica TaxID=2600598 RepID=UPI0013152298|nr:hypothetical protein [Pseudomonas saxonica]WRQ74951.1 hypothetical protein VQY67_23465 [Pseudomonas saxonica]